MKNLFTRFYWDIYSFAYGLVDDLHPHKEINNKIIEILAANSSLKFLDVGCGTGGLIALLNEKLENSEIYGIDISSSMLRLALQRISTKRKSNKIKLICSDINMGIPFPNNFFDTITCVHVINYVNNPNFVCREFERTLKKNGNLVIVTFKNNMSFQKFKRYHEHLIRTVNRGLFDVLFLPQRYLILTFCNLPIRLGYNINYYDDDAMDKFVGHKFKRIKSETVYLGCSNLIHYKKVQG